MDNNKLFIGNMSWNTDDDGLKAFFSQVGEVIDAKVIKDRERNRSKGFGFVTMASEADADKAIAELNGKELDGRQIKVAKAIPQKPRQ
jgi:RNA recognition motif-containing protein